ncbi:sugar phosphate isomerase/epimerase family protein [Chitinophaga arvensicola]|uniref:Sugar phosphate isomerase/epimerase n=1 Tax=Chitinophaga arvensicola TaxID=29529 RepID=A0A1I0NDP4_9BACT|nr:sugar phosphate isomerase/epimerase [Chitinophaga arvensicola]SEV99207.1 Sugar phosphate isomerase/epimerase [Chitinophaga arvensicola]
MKKISYYCLPVILACSLLCFGKSAVAPVWKMGIALYSFHLFPLETALAKTDSAGCRDVQGFAWQPVAKYAKNLDALSPEEIKGTRKLLDAKGIKMTSLFVGNADDPKAWEQRFLLAKALGGSIITCEPAKDQWHTIDSVAGRHQMKVAIHEHKKGESIYWHPDSVLAAIKGHRNIGACADLGHWARSGLDVVDCLKKLQGHILEIHLKDINAAGEDVNVGEGIIDYPAVVKELKRQGFNGRIYVEYEHDFENNVQGVKKELNDFNKIK